jgi:dUTP pyrophosphatase
VILLNFGFDDFVIMRGMRIAQMVIAKFEKVNWNLIDELSTTDRGASGFGYTGQ